jgi:hypothetical protein
LGTGTDGCSSVFANPFLTVPGHIAIAIGIAGIPLLNFKRLGTRRRQRLPDLGDHETSRSRLTLSEVCIQISDTSEVLRDNETGTTIPVINVAGCAAPAAVPN